MLIPARDSDDRILAYKEVRRNVVRESATTDREHRPGLYNVERGRYIVKY